MRAARRLTQRPAPTPAIAVAHCSLASTRSACTWRAPRLRMRLGLACAQRAPRSCSAGGGGLLKTKMVQLFVSMVTRIKRHLPAAHISLDVSPWVSDVGEWMGTSLTRLTRDSRDSAPFWRFMCACACASVGAAPFLEHGSVDYVHTSGGRTTAHSERIRAQEPGNLLKWSDLHRISGRGIIADTGYGVGGRLTDDQDLYSAWLDPGHLRDRINDGVVAVTFANPGVGWEQTVGRLRTTLPPTRHCFGTSGGSASRHRRPPAAGNATSLRGTRGSLSAGRRRTPHAGGHSSHASHSSHSSHSARTHGGEAHPMPHGHAHAAGGYVLDGGRYDEPRGGGAHSAHSAVAHAGARAEAPFGD